MHSEAKKAPQVVVVTTEPPGASILLNDDPALTPSDARTPFTFTTRVPPGRATFLIELSEYVPVVVNTTIASHGKSVVHAALRRYGMVEVRSNVDCVVKVESENPPPPAVSGLDAGVTAVTPPVEAGQLVSGAPKTLRLAPGRYQLNCDNPSYLEVDVPFEVRPGQVTPLNVELKPRPVVIGLTSEFPEGVLGGFRIFKVEGQDSACHPPKGALLTGSTWSFAEGVGLYCVLAYGSGRAADGTKNSVAAHGRGRLVAAERYRITKLTNTILLEPRVASQWDSLELGSMGAYTLDAHCNPDSPPEYPQACAAGAQLLRSRLGDAPRYAKWTPSGTSYEVACRDELDSMDMAATPQRVARLYEASCTEDFAQGCELAGLFYLERAQATKVEAERKRLLGNAAVVLERGCRYGNGGACHRLYSSPRSPTLSQLDVSCSTALESTHSSSSSSEAPWYSDKEEIASVELFGGHSLDARDERWFLGASILSVEATSGWADFFRLGGSIRGFSPLLVGYLQHDLSAGDDNRRYMFGAEWVTARGRAYAGPLFVEAGPCLSILWDTGGGGSFEQSMRLDLTWSAGGGIRISSWALSSGVRYFTAVGDTGKVGGRRLRETSGFWVPYFALETGLETFEVD